MARWTLALASASAALILDKISSLAIRSLYIFPLYTSSCFFKQRYITSIVINVANHPHLPI